MTEYSIYYETKLYPTQNEVLKTLKSLELPFYLTGGTALSRGYFNHRYSDDLDLFVNADKNFLKITETVINKLKEIGFSVEIQPSNSDSFSRIFLNKNIGGLNLGTSPKIKIEVGGKDKVLKNSDWVIRDNTDYPGGKAIPLWLLAMGW